MERFYGRLAAGETKVEALRNTKVAFLRSMGAGSHPYFWAPYVLWGIGDEPLPTAFGGPGLWTSIALTLFVLGLVSFRFRGRRKNR